MNSITHLFFESLRPVKLVTLPLYALAALGMLMADEPNSPDLHMIFHMAPWWLWALMSLYVMTSRLIGIFWWEGNAFTRGTTPAMGIIMWSMFFAASASAPNFSMGVLYLVAALVEVWILARAVVEYTQ